MARRIILFIGLVLLAAGAGACGSSESATAPSGRSGATINGALAAVLADSTSSVQVGSVEVVGANVSTPVQAGQFVLADVPAGSVRLRFKGPGTDATLPVGSMQGFETITIVVEVSGSQAAVVADSRNPNAAQIPVNGRIEGLSGGAAAFEFRIGGQLIKGDAQTQFFGDGDRPDTFANLANGSRVEVKASARNMFLYAMRIHINGSQTPAPVPAPPPQDTSASIEGLLTSLGGSLPNLQLVVAGVTVRTNGSTTVQRRGDKQDLSTLKLNMTLHVVGDRRSDGSIDARFIQIKDDAVGGAFEIEGSMGGLKGTCPALTFGVNSFSIVTGPATVFTPSCAEFKNGNKVRVRGTTLADGTVQATEVTRR